MGAARRTLLDKIWDAHLVSAETEDAPAVLYVDLHLVHEVTSPQAFAELRARGLRVRRPERTVATMDHAIPTRVGGDGRRAPAQGAAAEQVLALERNCREFGVTLYPVSDERQGIVHVIGPELGLTHPGSTIVCGDSHTSTHGAFGALAFGIGTSEVGHVLATQCLLQRKPKAFAAEFDGALPDGVTAKDLILALIARIGTGGATGHALEYRGSAIRALSMEERMTVCNMSIEAGARAGLVAPDDTTFSWLAARPYAPVGASWDAAVARWRALPTDDGAAFDRVERVDASSLEPMITWGTSPGMGIPVRGVVPRPDGDAGLEKALRYMGLEPGKPVLGRKVDVVFIGSCTNSRLSDLRDAARVLRGRKVAPGVRALVVPGSQRVKRQAEAEGLDRVFRDAGAEWREAGCSMCLAMNDDRLEPGQYAVSTSNRNFEGRQGPGGRTFLASPLTAAASAVKGEVADAREMLPRVAPVLVRAEGATIPSDADGARPEGVLPSYLDGTGPEGSAIPRNSDGAPPEASPVPAASSRAGSRRARSGIIRSRTVVLPVDNVDTDQIIPARFLVTTSREGLGRALFADWRLEKDGRPRAGFALNRPEAEGARVLVAGRNFGCGSSREHAVWALQAGGFEAVVSPSFADIFRGNALKNGLVPVQVDEATHASLVEKPGIEVSVDVERGVLTFGTRQTPFPMEPFARYCLRSGLDELAFLLSRERAIAAYEAQAGPEPWRS